MAHFSGVAECLAGEGVYATIAVPRDHPWYGTTTMPFATVAEGIVALVWFNPMHAETQCFGVESTESNSRRRITTYWNLTFHINLSNAKERAQMRKMIMAYAKQVSSLQREADEEVVQMVTAPNYVEPVAEFVV